jgi:hypothetical protein
MLKKLFVISFICWLSGCAALASRETFAACQVADMATTVRALKLNSLAYEANPIPLPLLFLLKIGLIVYVWNSGWNESKDTEALRAGTNILMCAPIPGNLKAAKP